MQFRFFCIFTCSFAFKVYAIQCLQKFAGFFVRLRLLDVCDVFGARFANAKVVRERIHKIVMECMRDEQVIKDITVRTLVKLRMHEQHAFSVCRRFFW